MLTSRESRAVIGIHLSSAHFYRILLGYGTYSFTESAWSYEYDRYVAFADESGKVTLSERGAAELSTRAEFEGRRIYQMKFEGNRLIREPEGGQRQLIYEGDVFSYIEDGRPLRKWRRVSSE